MQIRTDEVTEGIWCLPVGGLAHRLVLSWFSSVFKSKDTVEDPRRLLVCLPVQASPLSDEACSRLARVRAQQPSPRVATAPEAGCGSVVTGPCV